MSQVALPVGTQLKEYRIEAVLGSGAFGVTYKGMDENIGLEVAIKEYLPESIAERNEDGHVVLRPNGDIDLFAWCRERFIDEAKTLAQLRHPNIVRVTRFFQTNGTAYFVMDFEEGKSLLQALADAGGTLPEARVRDIFRQVLDGLAHVHQRRYLHRDIKPGNIYIRADGTVALLDFGAARLEMSSGEESAGNMITPGYAPPEQHLADGRQGPWSDLYAVGASMHRCLTGKTPVASIERKNTLAAGGQDPYAPLAAQAGQGAASPLLASIDWMLSLDAEARPQAVEQVLAAWEGRITPPVPSAGFVYVPRKAVRSYKILIGGPVGVGKTTAITSLSDSGVLTTEQRASDVVGKRKSQTTVAMDYGTLTISDSERVHIYGIPGQERFDFMWEILQKGAIGMLLLLDNSRSAPLEDLKFFTRSFAHLIAKTALVIGINRSDAHPAPGLHDYHDVLRESFSDLFESPPPVMEVDPRRREDMEIMVQTLLCLIDPRLETENE
jgi:serine/threonine protein kinase